MKPSSNASSSMTRVKAQVSIFGLLALELAAIVFLRRLGSSQWMQVDFGHFGTWVSHSTTEDALSALVRLATLAVAYYLLATTSLYLLASLTRVPAAVRAVEWATLPSLRRVIDQGVALTLVTSTVIGASAQIAMAAPRDSAAQTDRASVIAVISQDSVATPISTAARAAISAQAALGTQSAKSAVDTGATASTAPPSSFLLGPPKSTTSTTAKQTTTTAAQTTPTVTTPTTAPTTTTTTLPASTSVPSPTSSVPTGPTEVLGEQTHLVVSGDNLWNISAKHLAEVKGVDRKAVTESDVRTYWLKVIDANRGTLRSGNPDLIYPGESITLPSA